jgi:hypothetical protein
MFWSSFPTVDVFINLSALLYISFYKIFWTNLEVKTFFYNVKGVAEHASVEFDS